MAFMREHLFGSIDCRELECRVYKAKLHAMSSLKNESICMNIRTCDFKNIIALFISKPEP